MNITILRGHLSSEPRPRDLPSGDEVVVVGQVQRRFFRAGGSTQSRTEVVASLVAAPSSRRVEPAIDRVLERVIAGPASNIIN